MNKKCIIQSFCSFSIVSTLLSASLVFLSPQSQAAISPVSIAILPPIELPPDDFTITGVRMSVLWGGHRNVYGLDLGLVGNITDLEFTGIAVSGLFNYTKGSTTAIGLQLAGLANVNTNKTSVYGLQLAAVNVNTAASKIGGFQVALANMSAFTDIYGFQIGAYNRAHDVHGLQIGVINVADSLHGLQIGLLNFNHTGLFAVSPILNAGF